MKTKKIITGNRPTIKIQLDNRTTITVKDINALKVWKDRYPLAKVID